MKIIIIGSGPAGSGASLFLTKNNIPHTIIDKAIFPRDKVCGDGLSPKTIHILKKWNPEIIAKMQDLPTQFASSWGGLVVAPNGKKLDIPIKKSETDALPPGLVSRRIDFDHFLTQQFDPTWTTFIQGAEAKNIKRLDKGFEVSILREGKTEIHYADILIAADGDKSLVKKMLAPRPQNDAHFAAGIRAYYKGVKDLHPHNHIEFYFLNEVIPGYFWVFPLPDGRANVGVCMISEYVKAHKINIREAMLKAIADHHELSKRFEGAELEGKIVGWGLPLGSEPGPLSDQGLMLTGDAASLIDPISGEGIGNALYSGWLAAEAAVKAIQENNISADFFKENYDKRLFRCIGNDLRLSYIFQRICRYPWLINFIIGKAQRNKVFMETMSCIFDDMAIRAKLYSPWFYVRLLVGFFR